MINGRTWVCCCSSSTFRHGPSLLASDDDQVEFWTQLRSADGQRMLKRADGSEDLALRGFWEGLPAPTVALRMLRQDGRAQAHGYAVELKTPVPPTFVHRAELDETSHRSSPRGRRPGSASERRKGGVQLREQLHAKTGVARNSKAAKHLQPLS